MGTQVAHAPADATDDSALQLFLQREQSRDLLRFATAGSVDDGKSTLIGRLLFDSGQVPEDQIRAVEGKGEAGAGVPNLALLTDGLRAEREAGITIDVAYRYFSSARRRFILADTPGHAEYTRNMVTGASTADAVLVLVDAVRGIAAQTRRHAWITALLRGAEPGAGRQQDGPGRLFAGSVLPDTVGVSRVFQPGRRP